MPRAVNAKTHRHIRLHRDPHHYDPAHRLQTVTDSRGSKTLTYSYSPGGQRTRLQTSDGAVTSYGYDPVGRLTSLWAPDGGSVTLGYDPGGRLVEQRYPNGATTRSTWNADNTLAQLLTQVGSTTVSQHDYTYDAASNRVTHTERIGSTTTPYGYTYDPLNRLTTVT